MYYITAIFLNIILLLSHLTFGEEINLRFYEKRFISQFGEDGIIEKIFKTIGTTNKYYVEFGAGNGHFCSNTKYLREKHNWTGLLMDGFYPNNIRINLYKEFITAENICVLFSKYGVPQEFDLISIDIDRHDFYVWKALSKHYSPRVVVIEFNSSFNYTEDKVIKYNAQDVWDGSEYYGSSILALFNLGQKLGYSLVYQESEGVNLFFIRKDILQSSQFTFKNMNNLKEIYTVKPRVLNQNKVNTLFTSSNNILG